jgi:hypothetical protein
MNRFCAAEVSDWAASVGTKAGQLPWCEVGGYGVGGYGASGPEGGTDGATKGGAELEGGTALEGGTYLYPGGGLMQYGMGRLPDMTPNVTCVYNNWLSEGNPIDPTETEVGKWKGGEGREGG